MKYRLVTDLRWREQTVYIVGGGPSASNVNLTDLPGIVIGVNDSAVYAPKVDVAFSAAPPWIRERLAFISSFPGAVVLMSIHGPRVARRYRIQRPVTGLPLRPVSRQEYAHRMRLHNSGHEALRWASDMGARSIVLIGFDLNPDEPLNWHGGYEWQPDKTADPLFNFTAWAAAFEETAKSLLDRGVQVWNANPESRLRCFPFGVPR